MVGSRSLDRSAALTRVRKLPMALPRRSKARAIFFKKADSHSGGCNAFMEAWLTFTWRFQDIGLHHWAAKIFRAWAARRHALASAATINPQPDTTPLRARLRINPLSCAPDSRGRLLEKG